MAKINLLPWRAERRERRKREFFTHLIVAFVAAVVLVLLWGFWVSLRIGNQNDRNEYLQGQITQLDAKITEIQNLQKVKDHLLARKRIVEKLQSSRSQMVHLFDQIVQTIPAGARLTGLTQQGDKLTLDGVAQSNATVAQYMRNIEASPWMGPTTLVSTTNVHNDTNTPYEFQLVVALTTPKSDDNGAAPAAGSSAVAPAAAGTAATVAGGPQDPTTVAPTPMAAVPGHATSGSAAPDPAATPATAGSSATAAEAPQMRAASTSKGGARP
ncbi:MAG TPA: PilN domain-containing protein [Rhodanobacteraceae bacterium]